MEGGDDLSAVAGVDVNAAAAEGDEHVLNALFEEDLRGAVRALEIRDGDAGHFLCLDLVRGDEPAALQELVGDGLIRGGIQDDADAMLLGKLCYGLVGILIDLELQQNIGGIADALLTDLMSSAVMVPQAPGTMTISFWLEFSSTMMRRCRLVTV